MIISIANLSFEINPRYKWCKELFFPFSNESLSPAFKIHLSEAEIENIVLSDNRKLTIEEKEFIAFRRRIADALIEYDRCLFHAATIKFENKAYLITAPSGTGKSTQAVLWKLLYKEKVDIINGDKPVLEFTENGDIIVHSSPWKGKENYGGTSCAPLGGIICLKQAKHNKIYRISPRDSIPFIFYEFFFSRETEDQIIKILSMLERMLKKVPVWKLENLGDYDSAKLCHDTITGDYHDE